MPRREEVSLGAAAKLLGEPIAQTRRRVADGEIRVVRVIGDGWNRRVLVARADVLALELRDWIRAREAAQILDCTLGNVYALARNGTLPSRRIPRGEQAQRRDCRIHSERLLISRGAVEDRAHQQGRKP